MSSQYNELRSTGLPEEDIKNLLFDYQYTPTTIREKVLQANIKSVLKQIEIVEKYTKNPILDQVLIVATKHSQGGTVVDQFLEIEQLKQIVEKNTISPAMRAAQERLKATKKKRDGITYNHKCIHLTLVQTICLKCEPKIK